MRTTRLLLYHPSLTTLNTLVCQARTRGQTAALQSAIVETSEEFMRGRVVGAAFNPYHPAAAMTDSSARFNPLRATPNLLTISRICLAPFLVAAILEQRFQLSFVLFVIAGLTDALDGGLARILKQGTVLGAYLDPVADKLLLSTLFLVLTHMHLISTRVTVLVFGRDLGILMVSALLYAAVGRREFKPTFFGKASTAAQVCAVALVLLHQIDEARWVVWSREVALDATVVLTIASGLHYAWTVSRRTGTSSGAGAAPGAPGH